MKPTDRIAIGTTVPITIFEFLFRAPFSSLVDVVVTGGDTIDVKLVCASLVGEDVGVEVVVAD